MASTSPMFLAASLLKNGRRYALEEAFNTSTTRENGFMAVVKAEVVHQEEVAEAVMAHAMQALIIALGTRHLKNPRALARLLKKLSSLGKLSSRASVEDVMEHALAEAPTAQAVDDWAGHWPSHRTQGCLPSLGLCG